MPDITPDSLLESLQQIRREITRAPQAAHDAEVKAEIDTLNADASKARAFRAAVGNIEERKAESILESYEDAETAIYSRAEFNRIKLKIKLLEAEQMNVQSQAKLAIGAGA